MEAYSRALLKRAAAQLMQQLGWEAIQATAMEMLTDIMERYLLTMARSSHAYAEQSGRTYPVIEDMALVMQDMGIDIQELSEYTSHVDSLPFAQNVPQWPAPRESSLRFPKPGGRELAQREEHVHDHLPPMYPEWEAEDDGSMVRGPEVMVSQSEENPLMMAPGLPPDIKRPLPPGITDMTPPNKKARFLPDEAGHSMYEMKGVMMNHSGFLTPTRPGKLPDACTPPPNTPLALPTTPGLGTPYTPSLPSIKPIVPHSNTSGVITETVEERTEYADYEDELQIQEKEHVAPLVIPRSPAKSPGRPPGRPPGRGRGRKKSPRGRSPGRPPGSGRSPGRPPGSGRSPGRPPKNKSPRVEVVEEVVEEVVLDMDDSSQDDKLIIADPNDSRQRNAAIAQQQRLQSYSNTIDNVVASVCSPERPVVVREPELTRQQQMAQVGRAAKELTVTAFLQKQEELRKQAEEDEFTKQKRKEQEFQRELEKIKQKTKEWEKEERERLQRKLLKHSNAITASDDSNPPSEVASLPDSDKNSLPETEPAVCSSVVSFSDDDTDSVKKDMYHFDDDDQGFNVNIPDVPDSPPAAPEGEMRVRTKASLKMKALEMLPIQGTIEVRTKAEMKSPVMAGMAYAGYKSPSGSPSTVTTGSPTHAAHRFKEDKEHKKEKKKKKNKDKDKDKKDKEKKDKGEKREKKEKDREKKKEKEKRREEKKAAKEAEAAGIPRLTFKFGASKESAGMSVTMSDEQSRESTPQRLIIKNPVDPSSKLSRAFTPSPPSSPSPPTSPRLPIPRSFSPPPPSSIGPPPPSSGRGRKPGKKSPKAKPVPPPVVSPPRPPITKAALKAPPTPKGKPGRPKKNSPARAAPVATVTAEEEASQLRTVITETVGTIIDENGETIWICPACKMQDDGSPMVGCDDCDDWYHWVCVGIKSEPSEDEDWFCPRCNAKRLEKSKSKGGRPGKKKKKLK